MNQNIQSKTAIFFSSSATWTMIALFVYNAINANVGIIPSGWSVIVNIGLTVLAGYLHSQHVQTAAQLGKTN